MSASDVVHLAYDRVVYRRFVNGAKFQQGHATELNEYIIMQLELTAIV
jgi:hypothetical protein